MEMALKDKKRYQKDLKIYNDRHGVSSPLILNSSTSHKENPKNNLDPMLPKKKEKHGVPVPIVNKCAFISIRDSNDKM